MYMKATLTYHLPLTVFREGKIFIAYSPLLDLSSCGKTEKQAKRMFTQAVESFFETLDEMGTREEVLQDLGWSLTRGKLHPPKLVEQSVLSVMVPAVV